QIRVVEPNDVSDLYIEPGMDYCTLVTCTPYGINTQRLLIRGHRVENDPDVISVVADALLLEPVYTAPFIAIPMLAILLVVLMVVTGRQARYSPEELDAQLPARLIKGVKGKVRSAVKKYMSFLERIDNGSKKQ
ncbi:MAG: sortase, partial [Clostridia bacterium]|nr:sortase [Clostridia bacterium]